MPMNSRDLVLAAIRRETTPRVPWIPFTGVHAGKLIGVNATEFLQSADHIVAGLNKARELYQADGFPVVFDLQLEAEALGCKLNWAEETPPAVVSHPLADGMTLDDLPAFDPAAGRTGTALEATRRLRADVGDDAALYGLVCGPFTLALHLRGEMIFLDMFDDEEGLCQLINYCAKITRTFACNYIDAGADVIAVVDPMCSQIGPEQYDQFVIPAHNEIFDSVRSAGSLSSLFVCGDATQNIEPMCNTRCDNLSIDENVDLTMVRSLAEDAGKSFGGNLRLTLALLLGSEDDVRRDVVRCLDTGGPTGFLLAPGCDLPYLTPDANLQAVAPLIHDEYKLRIARTLEAAPDEEDFSDIQLPDYEQKETVYLDVIALDSAGCAPCFYMVQAAREAAEAAGGKVEVREHKITTRDGIAHMKCLGARVIPTLCVQGTPTFHSRIPDRNTLVDTINQARD